MVTELISFILGEIIKRAYLILHPFQYQIHAFLLHSFFEILRKFTFRMFLSNTKDLIMINKGNIQYFKLQKDQEILFVKF